jgi:hypothetical protein
MVTLPSSPPDRICISPQFGDGSKIESSREEEAEAAFEEGDQAACRFF